MKIVLGLLNELGVVYNRNTVSNFFQVYPSHPSFESISDLLDHFNISNAGVEIGEENFLKIPTPFIAKISSSEGDFCLITELDENAITYLNEKDKWVKTTPDKFLFQYSGVILAAEANDLSGEPRYLANKKKYKYQNLTSIVVVVLFLIPCLLCFLSNNAIIASNFHLWLIKLLGLAVTMLLLVQTFHSNNPFFNKLCSSNSGSGCSGILSSSAAKIFNGNVSWSEVGFFYFLTTFLYLCFSSVDAGNIFLAIINLVALPYTFYSVLYQYRKRTWCRLCIVVQIILWLEFLVTLPNVNLLQNWDTIVNSIGLYATILCFALSIWLFIKPFVTKNQQIPKIKRDLNRFKKDEGIFIAQLEQLSTVEPINRQYKITIGNTDARYEVTFVSNPFCMPCAQMHQKLDAFFNRHRDYMSLSIIYTGSNNPADPKNDVIKKLIYLYKVKGVATFENAMKNWYETGLNNAKAWLEKHNYEDAECVEESFDAHRIWCDENNITHTPTLFLNNHHYPSEYSFEDLAGFLKIKHN